MFLTNPPARTPGAGDNEPLRVAAIRHGLRGLELGNPIIYLPEVNSTNTYAADLVRAGAAEGTIILTDHQTAGRGRAGRTWKPLPNQQLILSFILRPSFPAHFLVMASAVAVAESIEEAEGMGAARVEVKWPNDVLVNGRKVCGILIETSDGVAILGMGINVNGALVGDAELAARATTLAAEAGRPIEREALAITLISLLDSLYRALNEVGSHGAAAQRELRDRWRARLGGLGRRVTIRQTPQLSETLEGVAEDVDSDGALLLRLDDGQLRAITWGDVE
jgi:BirA family biotin operon repressor/biotin-[acetyl-CoA-carboxylase] ligase